MNDIQFKLFQKVLEETETFLHHELNTLINFRIYNSEALNEENADFCFDMLKRIARILKNIDGTIKRDDMSHLLDYLFGVVQLNSGKRRNIESGTGFIESVNIRYDNICTDREVKKLIKELLNY